MKNTCYLCKMPKDLRPYGPGGSMVCFSCAFSTPESKKETENNFASQLRGSGAVSVIDGSAAGPYPLPGTKDLN